MTHFSTLRTKITDPEILITSLQDLGITVKKEAGVRGSNGQLVRACVVAVIEGEYDLGWGLNSDGSYDLIADLEGVAKKHDQTALIRSINRKYVLNKLLDSLTKLQKHDIKNTYLTPYTNRQAATVGRQIYSVDTSQESDLVWMPHLPEAKELYLGNLPDNINLGNFIPGSIVIFPDSKTIAVVRGNEVQCWNLNSLTQLWKSTKIDSNSIKDISISKDGSLLALVCENGILQILDPANGNCILQCQEKHSNNVLRVYLSPDSKQLVSLSNRDIRVWDTTTGKCLRVQSNFGDKITCLVYSPNSQFIALSGDSIYILDAATGKLREAYTNLVGNAMCWSPDGCSILVGCPNGKILILNVSDGSIQLEWEGYKEVVISLYWLPNSHLLASNGSDSKVITKGIYPDRGRVQDANIKVWDTKTGNKLTQWDCDFEDVTWSPTGSYCIYYGIYNNFHFWDTRHLFASQNITNIDYLPTQPLSNHLRLLPTALAQMHRLGIYPPLSLVQDLINLIGGHPVDNPLAQLAKDTGISELIALRWSAPARIGLVALLLHKIPFPDWEPPSGISPREISNALQVSLTGEPVEPQAPSPPISLLQEAAKLIDEQLLCLLTILGEQAVAAEPALPLRLLSRLPNLPALSSLQRQLLGVRVCFGDHTGRSIGNAPGAERGQVSGVETSSHTDWSSLLPSQLALPQSVLNYRYQRGELLFRTRELAEPPRLRPTVLLLDVTPPVFGFIEAITRIAAFAVANFLREAEIPVVLITTGDKQEQIMSLDNPQDLVEIWTQRVISPANEIRSLKLASAIRTNLKDESGLEPIILLLTHPWFGADNKISHIPGLRGLFVQYPSVQVQPAISNLCERYSYIDAEQTTDLGQILGYLMG